MKYWIDDSTMIFNYNYYNPIVITNYGERRTNKRRVNKVIAHKTWYRPIYVVEFGRVHHWTTNYNIDCHTENW